MYPGRIWDYVSIAGNPNTTWEYILEHYLRFVISDTRIRLEQGFMREISRNVNVTVEKVLKYPNLSWNPICVALNRNFTLDDVFMLINSGIPSFNRQYFLDDLYLYYSSNTRLTWEDVKTHGLGVWILDCVVAQSWFTKDMLDNEQYQLPVESFSMNPNLTMEIVLNTPAIYKQSDRVSCNPGITQKDIIDNPNYPWNWLIVSGNPNITLEFVLDIMDGKRLDWREISHHPNITWDMIIENPDLPWNKRHVSMNPNITWDIVRDNLEWGWSWGYLSKNKFNKYIGMKE